MSKIFFASNDVKEFYKYEGFLATKPIIDFLIEQSPKVSGSLVDIGCGSKPYRNFFKVINYVGVDNSSNYADVMADAKDTKLKYNTFDWAICNQVIEHVNEPEMVIVEIRRLLKKGGKLLLTAPQMGRLHGEPHDYYRFTKYGLRYILKKNGFNIRGIYPHGGFFRAIGSHINFFILENFAHHKYVKNIFRVTIINMNNIIFSVLDRFLYWEKDTLGYSVVAVKK